MDQAAGSSTGEIASDEGEAARLIRPRRLDPDSVERAAGISASTLSATTNRLRGFQPAHILWRFGLDVRAGRASTFTHRCPNQRGRRDWHRDDPRSGLPAAARAARSGFDRRELTPGDRNCQGPRPTSEGPAMISTG